jgi:hypothetical protein
MTSALVFRRGLAVLVLAGVAATSASGQQAPQRTAERGSDHLSLQFSVVTQDGSNIADLRPDEVSVRVGGSVRQIRSLQLIITGGSEADSGLPLPYGSNAVSAAGRTLAIIVDDESFRPGLETVLRKATGGLIDGLGPMDRVSLVTLPLGGTRVPFTTDHTRVRTAMSQIVGHASPNETGSDLACRTRRTLESLVTYFDTAGIREEAMTVMFITAALAAPRRDAVTALAPGMCELSEHLFRRVAVAAGAARAQFYVIRPGDAPNAGSSAQRESARGSDDPLAGLDHLTGVTGGKLLALTGSTGTGMDRVLRETAAYYLVTLAAQPEDRSGRSQVLDVDVSRRGVEVRSRPQITFAKPDPAMAKMLQPSLRDMLGTNVLFRDLPLRAAAFPALGTDAPNIRVVTLAEPIERGVKLESLGAVLFDRDGKVASQWLATAEELARTPVVGAMSTPPGAYRLRVAAIDSEGRSGTADYEVEAEIVRTGPLKISSLFLGLLREGAFMPKLQFTDEPTAVAYVELEGIPTGGKVSAAVELAQTLNGPAVVSVPLAVQPSGDSRFAAMGSIAVGALPPGDYIVRAIVGLEGNPPTRVVRTIRKAAPAR